MLSFRFSSALILATGLVLTGCGSAEEPVESSVELPTLEPQGGPSNGSSGMNGASPSAYHANVMKLIAALGVAAADPNDASLVNPAVEATGLLDTSDGREVFQYAARCALPTGTLLSSGSDDFVGGGILSTTTSWLTTGLSTSQQEDVLTCMIAHLNAFGVHVPIFLSGPSVAGMSSADSNGFAVEEAIWQAKIPTPGQKPVYYAWPLTKLLNVCGLTDLSWIVRICGNLLNTCGVQVRYDRALACTGSDGSFYCNNKPAIQTTLQDGAVCELLGGL